MTLHVYLELQQLERVPKDYTKSMSHASISKCPQSPVNVEPVRGKGSSLRYVAEFNFVKGMGRVKAGISLVIVPTLMTMVVVRY